MYVELPPVPGPRSSLATNTMVVPARTDGDQLNPSPCSATVVRLPWGTMNDWPPGMTPWKEGVLHAMSQSCYSVERNDQCSPLNTSSWVPPDTRRGTLC